ncbi:MAG: adenosylcobalamin-dependent ribonucleoside-diphosphate reductase [Candidatus Bipolaricaulota bacterium]|nr:adenosylcobalamin-dependent ribonucleoside-diphosphate reductase [Candidatus Bipolaricaulota bacterium]MCS7274504.1 adenosylcobalamin-dependent ribonucleoside-diphosphate reductase [Candidatus Bipolaricaulota bacterium]MDW8111099.1 adenosylcobalamin-dependent ribonucleoside-diphosphate reductase [Candidatus Bipolaricaulota bacterium]MDW8329071.1 adenosylcobalamin-dependent ribonucleoside-diphosphate reductase [Candidatus Bipolaricaulota bacterium]
MARKLEAVKQETAEFFGGDELRIRCFLDKYALRDLSGRIIEKTPPEMWERVAREIASVEIDAKRRREWEKKFYWLLEGFRFIPGGRIMFGAGQPRRATLLNCFPAGTQVWTRQGPKPIEQIEVGEEVLTHRNRFRPVTHTMSREIAEPLRSLKLWYLGDQTIYATKDHRFLAFDGTKVDWVTAQELTPSHYVRVGRIGSSENEAPRELDLADYVEENLLEEDESVYTATAYVGGNGAVAVKESKRVRRKIAVDERLGLWLGFFVAEGGITDHSVYFTLSKDERSYAEAICELTRQLFGVEATIQERTDQPGHWLRVYAHSRILADFVRSFFCGAVRAHEKELPAWFLTAPPVVQKAFIAGLFLGDGVVRDDFVKLFLANPSLVRQVFCILLRLGIVASLRWEGILKYTRHRGMWIHIGTQRYVEALKAWLEGDWDYESSFAEAPQNYFYKVIDGELFVKVKECGWTASQPITVYDLSVAEDHSFVAEFAVAHNCYVIPIKEDSIEGIFEWCKEAARTYSLGGGVGTDISILRPKGTPVNNSAIYSSGSVSFMELFSTTTGTIGQAGRRGALMITISVDHPDVLDFIEIKNDPERRKVQYANISVRVTDEFMRAVERDDEFVLRYESGRVGRIEKRVRAREIWEKLVKNAWASAEPGVIFWDNVKRESTTEYNGMEVITTNPCSEIPLEAYGACCLGNINLSQFVLDSFASAARVDWANLERALRYAVRFLDDVLDYNADKHPLPAQRDASLRSRRIGVGFTGFGDMLIKLNLKYDTQEAIEFTDKLFERIKHIVYDESTELAVEKGVFPAFDGEKHLKSAFIRRLDASLIEKIKKNGLRNAALLTVPPVGSGSVLAGCTSGIEPIFSLTYVRKSKSLSKDEFEVSHPLVQEYMKAHGLKNLKELPKVFVTAHEIEPIMRVRMQATIQKHIDHAISSTVNLAKDVSPETIGDIYLEAWKAGCKGITVYREGSREGILLTQAEAKSQKESEKPARATLAPRPRPKVVKGKTYRMKTELGTVFITVNEDEEGIVEVFVQGLGKSGTSTAAFTEAIGRLISLALRSGVKPSAIIDQLSLIRGSRPVVQEDGTVVFSVPDAIAKAIAEYLKGGEQLKLLEEVKPTPPHTGANGHDAKRDIELCPSCGGVVIFTNGCYVCSDCGFSECD